VRLLDKTLHIEAGADVLYALLTEAGELVRWLAPKAEVDPRPGGTIRWTYDSGDTCSGRFVELVPDRRIVFTFGWERPEVEVPPGSTTVEITLRPTGTGTELRLVHRGLAGPMADAHSRGWDNYLGRLAAAAEHGDPGPDPLAGERVPTAAELEMR
jgi:uncharacterized protein YndB with AHSA1/START domain